MSFWFYSKKRNTSSIYSASIPFELILLFFGTFSSVVIPCYMFNSSQNYLYFPKEIGIAGELNRWTKYSNIYTD